ncbi:hypothetical protein CLV78_101275 [Aliiruegeria haliotis]|uniref:Uncharacterized protein n=1 Tax=Aliiruegeria haliotis TaxID=1280846 RepID=A0A2T0RYE7_9RHOB|nr:hypothetical protein [Aliiruegeria haliotis]PRY26180.1 hypothetical protein CLV78_101275 [Aliiruegeria haliotis]
MQRRHLLFATLLASVPLMGCETSTGASGRTTAVQVGTPAGSVAVASPVNSGPGTNAGAEQLRAQLTFDLRWAGVPDACIAQLSTSTLAQVKGLTSKSARSSRETLQRRQRIRTAAAKDCPGL